ncbi:SanA/YdcF family protein [Nocardia asteroides]|uniref:SanA/YdcF family protein n=1 Tax=Nocardia asteroides TaxID=1824 RepID=UPI001E647DF2|nr:ElyC/SanA/YdcF family protein [Nocardia asteroides]UGT63833.1 YdcF family protein [Nocardia asteroides]
MGAVSALAVAVLVASSVGWIRWRGAGDDHSVASVPAADVAILFGAQIYEERGVPSPYLAARLDIGRELLAAGKVKALLVTGDNSTPDHDEPTVMRDYLVRGGVPERKVALDYAGFDTYQSCVRAKEIFGVTSAIVVTQDFSMPRTIALCRTAGIETEGVADTGQPRNGIWWKCWMRDQLAAGKAALAMITRPDPMFLGNRETSVRDAMNAP